MTEPNRSLQVDAERRAALAALREAEDLQRLGHSSGAVSRSYYAAFHAARSLLVGAGFEPKTHEGVRRLIGLHFVLPGKVPVAAGDALSRLASAREASDYTPVEPISAQQVDDAVNLARGFLRATGVS